MTTQNQTGNQQQGNPHALPASEAASSFTPGPWTAKSTDACIWPGTAACRRAPVAILFTASRPDDEFSLESDFTSPEEIANGRLIAAAPDMHAVLKSFVRLYESGDTVTVDQRMYSKILTILSAIEGE